MNRRAMPTNRSLKQPAILRRLGAICLAGLLAACNAAPEPLPGEPPLAGAALGGPFTLIAEDGGTRTWSDFEGQYRITYFGFTYCPDICPTDVSRLMQGYRLYAKDHPERAARIQPLFISIDPERDTPEVVGEFTDAFGDPLLGLTGSPEAIKLAADNFGVFYSRGEDTPGGGYLMGHSTVALLFDPAGLPLAPLPVDAGPQAIADELDKWVR